MGQQNPIATQNLPAPYVVCPASETTPLGSAGVAGNLLIGLLVVPLTTSPGEVQISDGGTNEEVFAGGASSVASLVPFFIPWNAPSVNGGYSVVTGANVKVYAFGNFSF